MTPDLPPQGYADILRMLAAVPVIITFCAGVLVWAYLGTRR